MKVFAMRVEVVNDMVVPRKGEIIEIENTLKAKQDFVGGTIQCVSINDEIDLIVNDDGKLIGLPLNRAWLYKDKLIDLIVGNAFCCRHEGSEFTDIKESDIPAILESLVGVVQQGNNLYMMNEDTLDNFYKIQKSREK